MSSSSIHPNQSPSSSSIADIINKTKKDYDNINNALLKNIEVLDNENSQLKTALTEMQNENKDKDQSIEASQKLILKLKEEYAKLFREYQGIEYTNNAIRKENEMNQKNINDYNKNFQMYQNTLKRCDWISNENERLCAEVKELKAKIKTQGNIKSVKDKDIKDKDIMIVDWKEKTKDWLAMIKQRELTIQEWNNKIQELCDSIEQKDEQLKVLVNFSKEINNENKSNVAELTKQAVKTIKIFYNTINNSSKKQSDNGDRIDFKSTATTFSDFEPIFKDNKAPILLEDAVNGNMYIPSDLKSWSKEFIMDMNLKTEWIKSELYSGIIRENTMISFLEDLFGKLRPQDAESIEEWCRKIIILKTMYEDLLKENSELKKSNMMLINNKNEFDLYTKKWKDDVKGSWDKMKEKFECVEKGVSMRLIQVNGDNKMINDSWKQDWDKLKAEIWNWRGEKQRKERENATLRKVIEDNKLNERLIWSFSGWNQYNTPMNVETFAVLPKHRHRTKRQKSKRDHEEINKSFHTMSSMQTDSFNQHNYRQKKEEITNLKDELSKMKSEMAIIISNPINNGDNKTTHQPSHEQWWKNFENEKLKTRGWEEELVKINKYCKSLEIKLWNNKTNTVPTSQSLTPQQQKLRFTFSPNWFIKMFYDINIKLFSSSELKMFYTLYNPSTIEGIISVFTKKCEKIKQKIYDTRFDVDTSYTDFEASSFINSGNANMNNSYKAVNDRIVRLKKLEFDFMNLNQFTKNYLIAQEIVVKMAFSGNEEIHFKPIEQLYKWYEDCLNYKIDDMSDDIIFYQEGFIEDDEESEELSRVKFGMSSRGISELMFSEQGGEKGKIVEVYLFIYLCII